MAPVINMVMMPVLLLSGIMLPMTLGPAWLQNLRDFMPFRWIVDGVRDTFVGDSAASTLLWGTAWAAALFALAVWWDGGLPQGAGLTLVAPLAVGVYKSYDLVNRVSTG